MSSSCCWCSSLSFPCITLLSSLPSHGLAPCSSLKTFRTQSSGSGIRPYCESRRRCGRCRKAAPVGSSNSRVLCGLLPTDPWSPNVDSQSVASQLFAVSLIPYLGFLYYITKSKTAPRLTLFGFYFLLAFVGATIPAGIYAKVHYGTTLSNVDWLHGSAESLLTLTNLFIVLGLRRALRKIKDAKQGKPKSAPEVTEKQSSV